VTDRVARALAVSILRRIEVGRLTLVEDGRRLAFGRGAPEATVVVRSPRLWRALLRGSRGVAASYRDGLWDTPDLTAVIRVAARNVAKLDTVRRRLAPVREPYQRGRAAFRRNTPRRSREDIAAHYDLGNELFALMLDPTMMYSGAVFERPGMSLADASVAKLERVCRKLRIGPRDHVLEIGTGWGGFAVHAARTRGCRVTTTTISREQHGAALARARHAGVEDRVTVLLDDYRHLRGEYDKLVSIEMIEAVGWKDFGTFFRCCSDLLAPDGAMLLQAIVMDDRAYRVERASRSFIRTLIFPNGCLPSREVIARCVARHTDLRAVHLEDLTPHYAETLRHWRENFDAAGPRLAELGYDQGFQRLWRMYLAYCEAGFAERRIGLVQTLLAKPRWQSAPTDRGVALAIDSRPDAVADTPGRTDARALSRDGGDLRMASARAPAAGDGPGRARSARRHRTP
jgi:cyclopropane-fatty-acyl-phospholipid synthase